MATLCLFGREVRGGAHHGTRLCEIRFLRGVDGASNAEVSDLHRAVGADQDVGRLHVAVHHAVAVSEGQRGRHFAGDVGGLAAGQLLLGPQDVGQGAALHVLHGHEVRIAHPAPVVDRHDVGVVQVGRGLGLTAEALDEGRVGGVFRKEHLHGHGTVEQHVTRQEHVGHAAAPDALHYLVAVVDDRFFVTGHTRP